MTHNESSVRSFGIVERLVGNSLAYIAIDGITKTLSFVPSVLDNYMGESFEERQITEGTAVSVEWEPSSEVVTKVSLAPPSYTKSPTARSGMRGDVSFRHSPTKSGIEALQKELHPNRDAKQSIPVLRAIPHATRKFGKLVDTSNLAPGDLLLTRDLHPDKYSSLITKVQRDGGYHADDARWTHAAMYVGDGAHVVEATFDGVLGGGNVRLTSLDEYSQGQNSLRFRRSNYITDSQQGWRLCVRAMSRLGKPYDFIQAVLMWFSVVYQGRGFFSSEIGRPTSAAVICSTLYADSHNEATRRSLGEINGACVPAWLSASSEFTDMQAEWLEIGN